MQVSDFACARRPPARGIRRCCVRTRWPRDHRGCVRARHVL